MTTENTTPPEPQGASTPNTEAAPPRDFHNEPWQILMGIRAASREDIDAGRAPPNALLLVGLSADQGVYLDTKEGPRPDKTNPAVHFGLWLQENRDLLVQLWRPRYVDYMNLRRLTERPLPGLRIVAADGKPLE